MAKSEIAKIGKKELVAEIAAKLKATKHADKITNDLVGDMYNALFEAIGDNVASGTNVSIKDFGTFSILTRKAIEGGKKAPNGKVVEYLGGNYPKFTYGKGLKDKVMATFGTINRPSKATSTDEVADEVVA